MAMIIVSLIIAVYYNVVMSYCLYFIAATFQKQVPWERCAPEWNETCFVRSEAAKAAADGVSVPHKAKYRGKKIHIDLREPIKPSLGFTQPGPQPGP